MLIRFCLYGFLKNQRYFEPFLLLALLEKGLSFLAIGSLVAGREIVVNLLEIPSGALADLFGRRRAILVSFVAYAASFAGFGLAESFPGVALAMLLFGVGEAFRTGSHKALIFTWLQLEGRDQERTRIYGLTRSFSKLSSALSALVAAALVFGSGSFNSIFFWSLIPCGLSILNLLSYPAAIDPLPQQRRSLADVWVLVRSTVAETFKKPRLRRLMLESMQFSGLFHSTKDYLQPLLAALAVVWLGSQSSALTSPQSAALLAGPVYFLLSLLAAASSWNAHRFAAWAGGESASIRRLWSGMLLVFAVIAISDGAQLPALTLLAFMALHCLQNLWRPILASRVYDEVDPGQGATVLSIESQAHRLTAVVYAPLFGWLADASVHNGRLALWPMACVAAGVALVFRCWPARDEPARPSGQG